MECGSMAKIRILSVVAAFCAASTALFGAEPAQKFSKAGYWHAEGTPRRVETLATGWEFSLDNFKTSKKVSVPHSIDEGEIGFEASGGVNRQQQAWYRRSFNWKPSGKRQFLHFEAVMGKSRFTLNGKMVAEHFGGYLPVHIDVTGVLKEGENVLEVWCDNSDDPSYPPGKPQDTLDFTYFGGVYRDVYLIETGEAYVTDTDKGGVWITTNMGDDGAWKISADVTLGGDTDGATAELYYDGKRVVSPFVLKSPALWTPKEPNLHFLRVDVKKGGVLTDRVNVRFGIRDFKFTMDGFYLNGKKYPGKLMGTNRHQDYLFIGNALPNSLHWRDVKKFKDCGMSIFRCAHYPQDPAFMDACDEMGMFVISATPGWQFWNKNDSRFEKRVYDDVEKMVRRDRSRPSHLFWEPILNETYFPAYFTTNVVAVVKRNSRAPNDISACDIQSGGSGICEIKYSHRAVEGNLGYRREWGDYVDDWNSQSSPSRVLREWGEVAMVRQANHYLRLFNDVNSQAANHFGGCLWHGTDHARGYHTDNFYGGIMTYARQKKYSWHALKSVLTDEPFVFVAHELASYSPRDIFVYSNCTYSALLFGERYTPGKTQFDYNKRQRKRRSAGFADKHGTSDLHNLRITLPCGDTVISRPSDRLVGINLSLDTEGLSPVADGADLVTVSATLVDNRGTPKRYNTETIRFSVEGEADIVGENPQVTRWGDAVVLIRPRASTNPGPIKIRAETLRKGKYAPKAGEIIFTPGASDVKVIKSNTMDKATEARLREVEAQQHDFDVKSR